jgi:CheY-like chemotaxis protein
MIDSDQMKLLLLVDARPESAGRGPDVAGIDRKLLRPLKRSELWELFSSWRVQTEPAALPVEPKEVQDAHADRCRILLVEDNEAKLMLAKLLLQKVRPDALILEASTGKWTLELIDEHQSDLFFVDIQMPEMDGYETSRKMRECQNTGAQTPVIAHTAGVTVVERRDSENAGMDGFLAKPIDIRKLKDILQRYLGQAAASDTPDFNRAALEKRLEYNQEIFKARFPVILSDSLGTLCSGIETG